MCDLGLRRSYLLSSSPQCLLIMDGNPTYREVRYYHSHSVQREVQCGIGHLELCPDYRSSSIGFPESPGEVILRSHVFTNGARNQNAPLCTHFAFLDEFKNHLVWDFILTYPIKYRDLCRNAAIIITAWDSFDRFMGGTEIKFFDERNCLRQGLQKLKFLNADEWREHVRKTDEARCMGLPQPSLLQRREDDILYDTQKRQEKRRMEHALAVRQGGDLDLDWMDNVTLARLQSDVEQMSKSLNQPDQLFTPKEYSLTLHMPIFPHKIIYDEKLCGTIVPHVAYTHPDQFKRLQSEPKVVMGEEVIVHDPAIVIPGGCFNIVADWEMHEDSPSEEQYMKLAKSQVRGMLDPNIEPNLKEKKYINKIVCTPHLPGKPLPIEEQRLLHKFRHCLKENKRALPKFLLSVDWNEEEDVKEIPEILKSWRDEVVLETSDALKLLGKNQAFQSPIVRKYAIDTLKMRSDEEMVLYMLQLVQALRYEPEHVTSDGTVCSPLALYLIQRSLSCPALANYFYWYLQVEKGEPIDEVTGEPLNNKESENYYIHKLEPKIPSQMKGDARDDTYFCYIFQRIFNVFCEIMGADELGSKTIHLLLSLNGYMERICACQSIAREERGRKDAKEARLKVELEKQGLSKVPDDLEAIPNPLDPDVQLTGMLPQKTKMFSSAIYPACVTFTSKVEDAHSAAGSVGQVRATDAGADGDAGNETTASSSSSGSSNSNSVVRIIFKSGDDLRQDQMIMQMIGLMNRLLMEVGIDGHLTTYGILATSKRDGIMELVQNSHTISSVLAGYKNSILAFLKEHNPDPSCANGVDEGVMEVFAKSTAASCVVTFILGIGDRHLDNIMIKPSGHLFHIDFGFIFGRDPKPLPPKFRFTREMADALGGVGGRHYKEFTKFACEAYNHLRKSADLILNLLVLMVDAGIPDLSENVTPEIALQRVLENFRLDLNDEEAAIHFTNLIHQTTVALAPRVMEQLHKVAVSMR